MTGNARHRGTSSDAVRKLRVEQLNVLDIGASWQVNSPVEAIITERGGLDAYRIRDLLNEGRTHVDLADLASAV